MVLLGLSILIASISFLCYRHPPSSWAFLECLRRQLSRNVGQQRDGPGAVVTDCDGPAELEDVAVISKEAFDRKAMPPPPPVFNRTAPKSPSPPTTPRATETLNTPTHTTPTIPSFTLENDSPPVPSFPALNSAQRASGGRSTGPRLPPLPCDPFSSQRNNISATASLATLPSRSPLPNRGPAPSSASSLAPPPTHSSIPAKPRKKVLLTPGHSPLDWARLSSSPTANLRGLPPSTPYLRVPPSLLKQFTGQKRKDAWTVLGGKVYNITPYLPYHPGGEPELLKAAGRNGTKLFGEVHPWVNWEGMLEGCLVGIAVEEGEGKAEGRLEEMD